MRHLLIATLLFCSFGAFCEDVPASAPTISVPSGSGNATTPAFGWSAVATADRYDLWVDDLTTGTSQVLRDQNVGDTTFTPAVALPDNHSFRAWVRAGNGAGFGPWSGAKDFATGTAPVSAPTGTPTVNAPAGGGNATTPAFSWTAVADATYYDLWVDDLTTGTSQIVRQQNVAGTTFTPATAIPDNHSFRTWVRAGNVFGYGPWSSAKDFSTGTAPIAPPTTAPSLTAPSGGGHVTTPAFTWTAVSGATFYYLWVDDLTTGTSRVIGDTHIEALSFTPTTPLADNHSYRAWVQAGNVFGYGPWSAAKDFATGAAPVSAPIGTPTVNAPTGGGNTTAPVFSWTAVADATYYDLWVDDLTIGTSQIVRQQNVASTTFTPGTAIPDNHSFRTWVRAGNVFGFGPWSAAKDFATGTGPVAPPTGTPSLTAPSGTGNATTPTFTWTAVSGASFYYLWVDDLTTGTSRVIGATHIEATSFTLTTPLADNHSFRVWVQAGNVFGYGPWSAAKDFATGTAPVSAPTGTPTVNTPTGTGNTTTPAFSWTAVADTTFYDLWVDDLTVGTSQVVRQQNVAGTAFTPATAIPDNHSFRTWVRSGNVFGYGPWSASKDFATGNGPVTAPASAPTVTAPTGPGNTTTPQFVWTAVPGADFYYLWVDDLTSGTSRVIGETHVTGTQYTPGAALSNNHSFRVWVQAGNVFGYGPWSAGAVFATGTGPVFAPVASPALQKPLAYANSLTPEFKWDETEGASYYELWVDDQTAGTSQVIHQSQVSATSYTPPQPLIQGHAYKVWLRAGNVFGYGPWSAAVDFLLDAALPVISNLAVSPQSPTNNARPTFIGSFTAGPSGIDSARTKLLLDGTDVTAQHVPSNTGFSFTPASNLSEGTHVLEVTVYSSAGLSATATLGVITDYTPPGTPVASSIVRTADHVTFSGSTDADATSIQCSISGAQIESQSASGGAWSVVVSKSGPDSFSLTARISDAAGNQSSPATFDDSFQQAPQLTPITINSITPQNPKFVENDVGYFDTKAITLRASISGGSGLLDVSIGTSNQTGAAGVFAAALNLAEGAQEVRVSVTDAAGQHAEASVRVVVDASPPEIVLQSPGKLTTGDLNFLFLNGLSAEDAEAVRNDPEIPRNVYGRDSFEFMGFVRETISDLDLSFVVEVRSAVINSNLNVTLQQQPLVVQNLVLTPQGAFVRTAPFSVTDLTTGLADTQGYLITLKAMDKLSNVKRFNFWVAVDTVAPQIQNAVGNHWQTGLPGPILGVETDALRVFQDAASLKRAWRNGPWMLETPVDLTSGPATIALTLEDLAGNKASRTLDVNNDEYHAGSYSEFFAYTQTNYYIDPDFSFQDVDQTEERNDRFDRVGDQTTQTADFLPSQQIKLDTFTVAGKNYVEWPPSWSPAREYAQAQSGSKPTFSGINFSEIQQYVDGQGPNSNVPAMGPGGEETSLNVLDASVPLGQVLGYNDSKVIRLLSSIQQHPTVGLNGIYFYPRGNWSRLKMVGPYDISEERGEGWFRKEGWSVGAAWNTTGFAKPRAFTVFDVSPNTLNPGEVSELSIRGYFGSDLHEGDAVTVSFTPQGAQGTVDVLPFSAQDAPPQLKGRLFIEDPFNRSAFQTVKVRVRPSADAAGTFNISVGNTTVFTLPKVVSVSKFRLMLDANQDGVVDQNDVSKLNPLHSLIVKKGFGAAGNGRLRERIRLVLDVASQDGVLDVPVQSILKKRGTLELKCNNDRVKLFDASVEGHVLSGDQLKWSREDQNLDQDGYVDPETGYVIDFDQYRLENNYVIRYHDPEDPSVALNQMVGLVDQMAWVGKDGSGSDSVATELPDIYAEFQADEEATFTLEYRSVNGSLLAQRKLNLVQLSNGLGAQDGVSASTPVVPGFAGANMANGNVYFGDVVRTYNTPAFGPGVAVSYNSQDGFKTGLGRGWRTNYDLRLFDNAQDTNRDAAITLDERAQGDQLALIDESGRRFVFLYDSAAKKFKSDPQGGMLKATVDVDAKGTEQAPGFDSDGSKGYAYKLIRQDNLVHYFNAAGFLMRIENLRGKGLTVERDAAGLAVRVYDDYGRSEGLAATDFGASGEYPATITGRQATGWGFTYEAGDSKQHRKIVKIDGVENYSIGYDSISGQANHIDTTIAIGSHAVRTISYSLASNGQGNDAATIDEPFGGSTSYLINPVADAWTSITSPSNVTTVRSVDANKRRVMSVQMGRYNETMAYDSVGNLISHSVSSGPSTTYSYTSLDNEAANLLETVTVQGAGGSTNYDYSTGTDTFGLVTKITDPSGNATQFAYGALGGDGNQDFLIRTTDARLNSWNVVERTLYGNVKKTRSPENRVTSSEYSDRGLALSSKDIFGLETKYGYDNRDRAVSVVQPGGAFTANVFDGLGRVTALRDLVGRWTRYQYDGLGRTTLVKQEDDAGKRAIADTRTTYSPPGGNGMDVTIELVDQNGSLVRFVSSRHMDSGGRIVSSTVKRTLDEVHQAENCVTTYAYTAGEGWLDKMTDANNFDTTYAYDDAGRLLETTTPEQNKMQMAYLPSGQVGLTADPSGRVTTFEYDKNLRPKMTTNPAGGYSQNTYLPTGQVEMQQASAGNPIVNEYDRDGILKKTTDMLGKNTEYAIDTDNRTVTSRYDNDSFREIVYHMDARGLPDTITSHFGTTAMSIRSDGLTNSVKPPARGVYATGRDALDRVVASSTPVSAASSNFDTSTGDLTKSTSPLGLQTQPVIDPATGDVQSIQDNVTANGNNSFKETMRVLKRDRVGNTLEYLDAAGRKWVQSFDKDNRVTQRTSPDGIVSNLAYNKSSELTSMTRAGETTSAKYNTLGQQIEATDGQGRVTRMQYDALGLKISSMSGGLTTTYEYDSGSRLLMAVNLPGGRKIRYTRYPRGQVKEMYDPKNFITTYDYDTFDRVVKITYPDLKTEEFFYKSNVGAGGNGPDLDYVLDRAGRKTKFGYDNAGRVVTKQLFDHANNLLDTITIAYNGAGQAISETSASGAVTHEYDERGRLTSVTFAGGGCTYTYFNDDQVETKTYAGKKLTYAYGAPLTADAGRLLSVTATDDQGNNAWGQANYAYNAQGRVATQTLPNNVQRTFGYDSSGRTTAMSQNLNGSVENFSYGYDGLGRLTSLSGPGHVIAYGYDARGFLSSERRTGTAAYNNAYAYDNNGNRTQFTTSTGFTIASNTLDFQGATLPAQVEPLTGSWSVNLGKLIAQPVDTGTSAQANLNLGANAGTTFSVKVQPETAGLTAGGTAGFAGLGLNSNASGRYAVGLSVTKELEDGNEVLKRRLRLDWIPAATGEPELIAQGDPVAYNNEELTLRVSLANGGASARVLEDGDAAPELSTVFANGAGASPYLEARGPNVEGPGGSLLALAKFDDFTWETITATPGTSTYSYDSMNRLLAISGVETASYTYNELGQLTQRVKNGVTADYTYDRLNRLTSMAIQGGANSAYGYYGPTWMRASATVNGVATTYQYDGMACVAQTTNGATTRYAVPGGSALWEHAGAQSLTYAQDGQGNVTGLWNGTSFVSQWTFDAFGVRKPVGTPAAAAHASTPGYRGELHDEATDDIYLRNRQYTPGIGRFNVADPIGYEGGLNLYNYCGGDPVNRIDPSGTAWWLLFENVIIAGPVEAGPTDETTKRLLLEQVQEQGYKTAKWIWLRPNLENMHIADGRTVRDALIDRIEGIDAARTKYVSLNPQVSKTPFFDDLNSTRRPLVNENVVKVGNFIVVNSVFAAAPIGEGFEAVSQAIKKVAPKAAEVVEAVAEPYLEVNSSTPKAELEAYEERAAVRAEARQSKSLGRSTGEFQTAPNAGGFVRSGKDLTRLISKRFEELGVKIPNEIQFKVITGEGADLVVGEEALAQWTVVPNKAVLTFEDLTVGGVVNVKFSSAVLASDEAAIATAAHELAEIQYVYDAFGAAGGKLSRSSVLSLIEEAHTHALKYEAEILARLRGN